MRAHIVRSRGQVAVHGRTPAVAARMPPAVLLVINLRIRAAADCCCGSSSSSLLPDSVKPAAQRGVQNLRGFVPPEAESAFEPFDRSWMVPRVSLRRGVLAMAGLRSVRWRAERATKQREKHGSDAMSQNVMSWRTHNSRPHPPCRPPSTPRCQENKQGHIKQQTAGSNM